MEVFDRRRLKLAEILKSMSAAELSRRSGVAASYLSRCLKNPLDDGYKSIGELTARKIELGAGKPEGWLDVLDSQIPTPRVLIRQDSATYANNAHASNVVAASVRKTVPLISWVKAGGWGDVLDQFEPGQADQWIECYETTPGGHAFALTIEGDSMTSPHLGEVSFPTGMIIIVDPYRSASAGDYVIAKDVATQQATFKKLVHDGGRWYLKPLNPSYPTIEIDDPATRIIGRVVESRFSRKF